MKKVLFILITGLFFSFLISCFSTEHYLIKGIRAYAVEAVNPQDPNDEKKFKAVDKVNERLYIKIEAEAEYLYGYINSFSLIQNSYATSVPVVLDNDILIDSIQLMIDKDISFGKEVISKNTDLWNHPEVRKYRWYNKSEDGISLDIVIGFTNEFYDSLDIPDGVYNFTIICKTTDNQLLEDNFKIALNL